MNKHCPDQGVPLFRFTFKFYVEIPSFLFFHTYRITIGKNAQFHFIELKIQDSHVELTKHNTNQS